MSNWPMIENGIFGPCHDEIAEEAEEERIRCLDCNSVFYPEDLIPLQDGPDDFVEGCPFCESTEVEAYKPIQELFETLEDIALTEKMDWLREDWYE